MHYRCIKEITFGNDVFSDVLEYKAFRDSPKRSNNRLLVFSRRLIDKLLCWIDNWQFLLSFSRVSAFLVRLTVWKLWGVISCTIFLTCESLDKLCLWSMFIELYVFLKDWITSLLITIALYITIFYFTSNHIEYLNSQTLYFSELTCAKINK